MKFPSMILGLASLATFTTTAVSTDLSGIQCLQNHGNAYNAINAFCDNPGIMVPSAYSKKGKHYGNIFVKIGGESTCDPPQWVPSDYCRSQFYDICITGPAATGKGNYGHNGCQSFHIGKIYLAARGVKEVDDEEE